MKKILVISILFLFIISLVGFGSANEEEILILGGDVDARDHQQESVYDYPYCSSKGYECGFWENDTDPNATYREKIDCGKCPEGECLMGKCYSSELLGKCSSLPYGGHVYTLSDGTEIDVKPTERTPCSVFSDERYYSDYYSPLTCETYGCNWDESSSTCSGTSLLCSELSLSECNSPTGRALKCVFDGPFAKKLYWTGREYLNQDILKNLQGGQTIPIEITFVDPTLSLETEIIFNVYSFNHDKYLEFIRLDKGDKGWFEESEPFLLKTFSASVNQKGEAIVRWDLSIEDLKKINYGGEASFVVDVSLKDGNKIISAGDLAPRSGGFAEVDNQMTSIINLPPRLTRNKFGTVTSIDYPLFTSFSLNTVLLSEYCHGTFSCNIFQSKADCELANKELKNIKEYGFELDSNPCIWNENTFSCEGESSCILFGKNQCENKLAPNCSWESDILWEKFILWFRNLFD